MRVVQRAIQNSVGNNPRDLFFSCEHCGVALVVDASAAGMTLSCQQCGRPTVVPSAEAPLAGNGGQLTPERLAELERQLKENESQRTEINGYINQLQIQLHRWQLRLQTLESRQRELTTEIASFQPTP